MNRVSPRSKRVRILAMTAITASTLFAAPASAAGNLVGEYTFEDLYAAAIATDTATGNNGVPFGSPAPASSADVPNTGEPNLESASFDGQNYFQINNTIGNNFTICAWVKTASVGGETHWTSAPIAESESGGWNLDFGFGINSQGKLIFGNGGYDSNSNAYDGHLDGNTVVNDSTWHHLCATRDNTTGAVKLYVDGNLDASGTTGTGLLTSNSLIRIGNGTDGNSPFVGLIDDLRIYNSVLTDEEISGVATPEEPTTPEPTSTELADTGATYDGAGLLWLSFGLVVLGLVSLKLSRRKNLN